MKTLALATMLVLLGISYAQLVTDSGGPVALNLKLDCSSKVVQFETNESEGLAVLMYGDLLIDKAEGNISKGNLSFYGKLNLITYPFTFRVESDAGYRIAEFYIDECKTGAAEVAFIEEILPEEEPQAEEQQTEKVNETEEVEEKLEEKPAAPQPEDNGSVEEVPVEIVERSWIDVIVESIKSILRGLGLAV